MAPLALKDCQVNKYYKVDKAQTTSATICGGFGAKCESLDIDGSVYITSCGDGHDQISLSTYLIANNQQVLQTQCNITPAGEIWCGGLPTPNALPSPEGGKILTGTVSLWGGDYCLRIPNIFPDQDAIQADESLCKTFHCGLDVSGSRAGDLYLCPM